MLTLVQVNIRQIRAGDPRVQQCLVLYDVALLNGRVLTSLPLKVGRIFYLKYFSRCIQIFSPAGACVDPGWAGAAGGGSGDAVREEGGEQRPGGRHQPQHRHRQEGGGEPRNFILELQTEVHTKARNHEECPYLGLLLVEINTIKTLS